MCLTVCRCFGRSSFHSVLLCAVLLLSSGTIWSQLRPAPSSDAEAPVKHAAAAGAKAGDDYIISADDVLELYVLDVSELSRQYRVSPSGYVTLPLLSKSLPAAGKTIAEFSQMVSDALRRAELVSNPHLTISVVRSRLYSVTISGAVKRPQIYPVFSKTTLQDVLSQAEGLADNAGNQAIVRRGDLALQALGLYASGETPEQLEAARTQTVELAPVPGGGLSSLNFDVYPGDRITIPQAGVVYVVGAVNRPGGFPIRSTQQAMPVLQALALAEDLKSTAMRDDAVIIRGDVQAPNGRKQIPVNLKKLLAGKQPDPDLQPDDILFVPDSSSKRALKRGLEAVLQTATGVAIYRR